MTIDIFPIHRDAKFHIDWFRDFESGMRGPSPALSQEMLFTGPGLARNWHRFTRNGTLYQQLLDSFKENILTPLADLSLPMMNVVDLGVGDYVKAGYILGHLMSDKKDQLLRTRYQL